MGDIIDTHNRIFRSKRLKTNLNSIVTKNSPWRLHAYIYRKITHRCRCAKQSREDNHNHYNETHLPVLIQSDYGMIFPGAQCQKVDEQQHAERVGLWIQAGWRNTGKKRGANQGSGKHVRPMRRMWVQQPSNIM